MRLSPNILLFALLAYSTSSVASLSRRSYESHDYYVIEHDPSTQRGASLSDIAKALGVEVVERVGELADHWLVRAMKPSLVARDGADPVEGRLQMLRSLASTEARSINSRSTEVQEARAVVDAVKYFARQELRELTKRAPIPSMEWDEGKHEHSSKTVADRLHIQDPYFGDQWHLVNEEYPEHTMNVTGLWDLGITGKGVITALLDDGLDFTHDDFATNYHAAGSYNYIEHIDQPIPSGPKDHHGTRCAGQIAAGRNNKCGVGIAYDSKVAGLRILGGKVTTVDEAAALNYKYQETSIYSCSWGPRDDGQHMAGPNYLIKKAVANGIANGRGGKGSVFVFAAGNGGRHDDQCNFDGYTNSIYSVTVGSIDFKGLHPSYSEPCAANMIVAYSSGSGNHIVTTDRASDEDGCSMKHGGTSAAAPNVAGVLALALSVRPELTWRDIQYLCVETARIVNEDDPDWDEMATGRLYSYKYGFGALDAYRYVMAAKTWKLVNPQTWFQSETVQISGGTMNIDGEMKGGKRIIADGTESTITIHKNLIHEHGLDKLEQMYVKVWITHTKRGDVEVELVSPNGISSVLAARRPEDYAETGFPGWTFMTLKHWGENPVGDWTIRVYDQGDELENGNFLGWNMMFFGAAVDASHAKAPYDEPPIDYILPPAAMSPTYSGSVTTTFHSSPTANLPEDHGSDPGEKSKPAFNEGSQINKKPKPKTGDKSTTTTPVTPANPTKPADWVSDVKKTVSDNKMSFGSVVAVIFAGIAIGAFWWRRRQSAKKLAEYRMVSDDLPMSNRSRDGLVSRDAEDDGQPAGPQAGLVFHDEFLDDDVVTGVTPTAAYRDEPEDGSRTRPPPKSGQSVVSVDLS